MEKIDLTGLSPEIIAYISTLEKQVENLSDTVNKLQKVIFGQSSEKTRYVLDKDSNQISLFNEAEELADDESPEPKAETIVAGHVRKKKRTREQIAANLPVIEIICDLPKEEQICDICESKLRYLGKEHVRDELEIIPAQVRVLRYVRYNYVCTQCELETTEANVIKSPVPQPVMKKSLASPSSVAHVMYEKYANAMPLYRQEQDWKNKGVDIPRATLANWIIQSSNQWLRPIYEEMKKYLLTQDVIHADETVIQVLKEPDKKPTSESRMWVYCSGNTGGHPSILFEYQPSRSGRHAKEFLEGFHGYLQTDGYSGYNALEDVTRCGCYAHLRRKFEEALPKKKPPPGDSQAAIGLDYCNQLFALEKQWVDLTPEQRLKERQEHSKPVLDAYWSWLETVNPLAGSGLGKAVQYSLNQKEALNAFMLDGRIEISNNRAENAIRLFVVGRKNWLFSDTPRGADASATVYSIIETAKANNLNPYKYLVHLFKHLPSLSELNSETLESFLPWSPEVQDQHGSK
jgi:transposase